MEPITSGLLVNAQNQILTVLCEAHDFDVSRPLTVGEAKRLQSFIDLWDTPEMYPQIEGMDRRLFWTARSMLKTKIADALASCIPLR